MPTRVVIVLSGITCVVKFIIKKKPNQPQRPDPGLHHKGSMRIFQRQTCGAHARMRNSNSVNDEKSLKCAAGERVQSSEPTQEGHTQEAACS